jgi:hypothetical protein
MPTIERINANLAKMADAGSADVGSPVAYAGRMR